MPSKDRDRRVLEEAQWFCDNKSLGKKLCNEHKPTLEELQRTSFSDYVSADEGELREQETDSSGEFANNSIHVETGGQVEAKSEDQGSNGSVTGSVNEPIVRSGNTSVAASDACACHSSAEKNEQMEAPEKSTEAASSPQTNPDYAVDRDGNVEADTDAEDDIVVSTTGAATDGASDEDAATNVVTPIRFEINTRFKHRRVPPVFKPPPRPKPKPKQPSPSRTIPIEYSQGMSKVTLPKGFWDELGICQDRTGRGPDWQRGTKLGDIRLPSPMKQCLRGIGGIYEYTFLDQKEITAAEFREKADQYFREQVGTETHSIEQLERKFWRRLGPTMPSPMYGADMEGSMFGDDDCYGWNLSKLQSCLQLLMSDMPNNQSDGIPGVTTPYLYFGMWASVFCTHAEDMNLLSINYLHAGAPKIWYAIAPGEDARRFEQLCEGHYHISKSECAEYLRHKRSLVSPQILKKAGIPFTSTIQYPGDAVITFPAGYHFGFNSGFNLAEATNFAVPEWIPFGKQANVCLCRPDSVRIDMSKFENLLDRYERDKSRRPQNITWKDWALQQIKKQDILKKRKEKDDKRNVVPVSSSLLSKQQMKKEIWVEVVQPYNGSTKSKLGGKEGKKTSRKRPLDVQTTEIWHLAKPIGRKTLRPPARVLCIIPATVIANQSSHRKKTKNVRGVRKATEDEEDEQCFAGTVIECTDDHVRVRLDGLTKKDDIWMPLQSPKLFIDGGLWNEGDEKNNLPALHYWLEDDSKQRCV